MTYTFPTYMMNRKAYSVIYIKHPEGVISNNPQSKQVQQFAPVAQYRNFNQGQTQCTA